MSLSDASKPNELVCREVNKRFRQEKYALDGNCVIN